MQAVKLLFAGAVSASACTEHIPLRSGSLLGGSSMYQHTVCAPARDGMQSLHGMNFYRSWVDASSLLCPDRPANLPIGY